MPFLKEGAGVTLTRGDIHYVVTEYGIAYLHGKNIRERAMELISIAHPKFRPWLIEEAKAPATSSTGTRRSSPGSAGEYPEDLETRQDDARGHADPVAAREDQRRAAPQGLLLLPLGRQHVPAVHVARKDMPHERLQEFVVIDYTKEMVILACVEDDGARPSSASASTTSRGDLSANVAFTVRDEYQNKGVGTELLAYLIYLAKRQGLLGLTAEVLVENKPMLHVFEKMGVALEKHAVEESWDLRMRLVASGLGAGARG